MSSPSVLGVVASLSALVVAGAALVVSLDAKGKAGKAPTETAAPPRPSANESSPRAPAVLEAGPADDRVLRALDELRVRLARVEGRVGLAPRAPGDDGKDVAPAAGPPPVAGAPIADAE